MQRRQTPLDGQGLMTLSRENRRVQLGAGNSSRWAEKGRRLLFPRGASNIRHGTIAGVAVAKHVWTLPHESKIRYSRLLFVLTALKSRRVRRTGGRRALPQAIYMGCAALRHTCSCGVTALKRQDHDSPFLKRHG